MNKVIREIELDKLIRSPHHVRKDLGDIDGLTDPIRDIGVQKPIHVRPVGELYEVYDGIRLVEAARRAGQLTIPAIVEELSDTQVRLRSLLLNILHKKLTLEERVAAYQELMTLDPAWSTIHGLAKAIGLHHQKITQDFQAWEMATRIAPYGIAVASDLHLTDERRQRGEALPEYHAVLLQQASDVLKEQRSIPEDGLDAQLAELARQIAPHSQKEAKEIIAYLKSADNYFDKLIGQQETGAHIPPRQYTANPQDVASGSQAAVTVEAEGGMVTCAYCEHQLSLRHLSDGMHQVTPHTSHLQDQQASPGLFS